MKVHEVINSPHKWCQGAYSNSMGQHCASGAAAKAWGLFIGEAENLLSSKLRGKMGGWGFVNNWNDHSTWQQVYGTLKELDI